MAPRQGAAGTSVARAVEEPPASAPLLGFLPAPAVGFRPPVLTARSSLVGRPPLRGVRVAPVSPVGGRSAAAAATAAAAAAVPRMFLKVCRQCKQQYDPEANEPGSCRYHGAQYRGRLNRIEPTETSGLEYFWHCCGDTDVNAEGCVKARHSSYDDA
ncbi:hypothetical protein BU14_0027s0046 [Porphyra umbilicalis]|uniref:Uncharacterized protein n=1 Tax=Porphyra umbilicalis TaxID=2786 RepID=A0A1X6PJI3_PORUM|nr:hypothetical protein BU14_0027s0046 [Porphyra umbilicalis]|eukprot:OSX81019.1 hypothetical protein BU14_0027s0046 [Porphyra umbilicalis]